MKRKMKRVSFVIMIMIAFVASGCNSVKYSRAEEAKYVKPTIAVMSFENKAPVNTRWMIGDGIADQLIDRLMATRRYTVLERQQLSSIMRELNRTKNPAFRIIGQPALGQLKHVKYLIKGTITDFGHVETVEGMARLLDWGWFGSSSYALVSATLYVVDIESGQVIASSNVSAKIKDKKDKKPVNLDGMAFGGYTFYHTTIGKATNEMLDKAVIEIARAIAEQQFQPKISSIANGQVIINGGRNRKIKVDDEFIVRPASEQVLDPDTGDLLGHITGETIGRVRVIQITDKFAICTIVKGGGFEPGQTLFKAEPENLGKPTAISNY